MSKKPIVELISFTPDPIQLMMYVFKNMLGIVPSSFEKFLNETWWPSELDDEFMRYLAHESLSGGVQEFVSTVWYLGNVSRAFQQQLTRHRTAAYCIQSLRVQPQAHFAEKMDYHMPPDAEDKAAFKSTMRTIQTLYDNLLAKESPQVARGVLPLNIYSPITMVVNLRNLRELVCTRLCNLVQGEFKNVAFLMVNEVCEKIGEEFRVLFRRPCERLGFCPHAEGCGATAPREENLMSENLKDFLRE